VVTKVRAMTSHQISERPPLRVEPGQRVHVGERDTKWPAFVFVTADDGAGWVPSRYLDAESGDAESGDATAVVPYDTRELPTTAGEALTVLVRDDLSGWVWVQNAAGRQGWVPNDSVEPLSDG